ncbi:beta-defensin 104A-like [Callospermophilus lateralis]|uniref:beta-defensin 104A-like n=1 Tax=Callospermophilus lateralis TaxID=76772 RepID=UPI00405486A8
MVLNISIHRWLPPFLGAQATADKEDLVLLLAISLFPDQDRPGRSHLETDRICGYGTARCRWKCKTQEHEIGRCPNTSTCCLKTWKQGLNPHQIPSSEPSAATH